MIKNIPAILIIFTSACLAALTVQAQDTAQKKAIDRLFESGNVHRLEKRFPLAIADYQKIFRLDPDSGNARFNLAETYIAAGDYDKAIAEIEIYNANVKDDAAAWAMLGEAYLKKGEVDRAIEYFTEKIAEREFAHYFQNRAEAYVKKNMIDEAISDYTSAIEQYDHPGYVLRRAALYAKRGDKKAALTDYLALLENFPDYEKVRREALKLGAAESDLPKRIQPSTEKPNAAAAALFQNAFDELTAEGKDAGIYFFDKAARTDPKFAAPYYYSGLIYDTQVLYGSAFKSFAKAFTVNPNFVEPRLKYADRVRSNGYFEIAAPLYERVLEIDPSEAQAFLGRGLNFLEESEIYRDEMIAEKFILQQKALKDFNRAVELNPKLAEAHRARADLLFDAGKLNEALVAYNAAISAGRNSYTTAGGYEKRAAVFCLLGEKEKATADEAKANEIGGESFVSETCAAAANEPKANPQTAEERRAYIAALTEKKNFAAALAEIEKSLKTGETAQSLTLRGKIYLFTENYDAALADATKAIALDPSEKEAYKIRAVLYLLRNKSAEAIADYATLVKLEPENALHYGLRAGIYANAGQTASALADYSKAIGFASDDEIEFRIKRGDLFLKNKNYKAAIADYNIAVEQMPLRISIYPKRAAVLCAAGNKTAARADWQTYKKHGGQKIESCL